MATGNEWLTGSDWTGGTAPGETGNAASTNSEIAVFNDYSSSTIPASGLGIDMTAATGHLALGAIELNSDSGTLRIGNSSTTDNGLLRLNGATTTAGAGTIIDVSGSSDLVLADAPDASNPSGTTLGVTLGSSGSQVSIAPGRTVTITSAIGEAAAGAELSLIGGGRLALGGTNTFSGGTTISAGKLVATSAATLGSGPVTIAGGELNYVGSDSVANAVVLSGAASGNTISVTPEIEYLVIGGGGGGAGRDVGGGGGAGGYRSSV